MFADRASRVTSFATVASSCRVLEQLSDHPPPLGRRLHPDSDASTISRGSDVRAASAESVAPPSAHCVDVLLSNARAHLPLMGRAPASARKARTWRARDACRGAGLLLSRGSRAKRGRDPDKSAASTNRRQSAASGRGSSDSSSRPEGAVRRAPAHRRLQGSRERVPKRRATYAAAAGVCQLTGRPCRRSDRAKAIARLGWA